MAFQRKNQAGFTLIELLTVIAIIGILSGFVFAVVPGILLRAKVTDAENTMNQIRLSLLTYFTEDQTSFPPAYGYLDEIALKELSGLERRDDLVPNQVDTLFDDRPSWSPINDRTDRYYVSRHYMHFLKNFGQVNLHDRFALDDNDSDFDNYISRLEYVPPNGRDTSVANYSTVVIRGGRPFIYVPVQMRQFKKVAREWINIWRNNPNPQGPRPDDSVGVNTVLQSMHFPPPYYDAFVLISVGPDINTRGIVYDVIGNTTALRASNYAPNYRYHVAALATFFMATRDLNVIDVSTGFVEGDGELDFNYKTRISGGQDDFVSNYYPTTNGPGVLAPIILIGGSFDRSFED